ncbi:hypothetical protein [Streptomyces jumonjinensis]|uniref:hypothetical protein n=1 Tax=Streptomyces jumonjinensis TaxID=1945 RepID=UPI0037AFF533
MISLAVLAFMVVYSSMPSPRRGLEDTPAEGTELRCYCYACPNQVAVGVEPASESPVTT